MTEGERLPYTLAVHRGDGENPHAHLMFSERVNDGIERSREQWFRRTNRKEPEKGGARKSRAGSARDWMDKTREAWEREANEALERAGYGERIDRRSLAERRDEAYQAGDLERAAELSRKPNVHLGPQAYRAGDLEREDRWGAAGRGAAKRGFGAGRAGGAGQSGASTGAGRPHRADQGEDRGDSIGSFRRSRRRSGRRESGSRRGKRRRSALLTCSRDSSPRDSPAPRWNLSPRSRRESEQNRTPFESRRPPRGSPGSPPYQRCSTK